MKDGSKPLHDKAQGNHRNPESKQRPAKQTDMTPEEGDRRCKEGRIECDCADPERPVPYCDDGSQTAPYPEDGDPPEAVRGECAAPEKPMQISAKGHGGEKRPNAAKLSDRGWRRRTMGAKQTYCQPLFAGARG